MEDKIKIIPTTNDKSPSINDYGNNKELSMFVGIRYGKDNNLRIHLPKSLFSKNTDFNKLEVKNNEKLLKLVLESIRLAERKSRKDSNVDSNHFEVSKSFPYYSYLWISNDFKTNGRLLSFETITSTNPSGKINWKRTMTQDSFIYNDDVIITDLIYNSRKRNEDLLTEIYDFCVYRSIEAIYFISNLSKKIIHPLHKKLTDGLISKYKQALLDELSQVFDDEKKLRYNHMLSIINSEKNIDTINGIIYGVDKYNLVFEKMIDRMFGSSNIKKDDYYPKATLIRNKKEEAIEDDYEEELSKLRPDTINISNNCLMIIDSKFYEFGNMPKTSDVAKQIVYGQYAEKNKQIENIYNIYNIFLIPKHIENGCKYEYIGYSKSYWMDNDKSYEYVLSYYIDLRYVVSNYKKGYDKELIDSIRNDVVDRIGDIMKNIPLRK